MRIWLINNTCNNAKICLYWSRFIATSFVFQNIRDDGYPPGIWWLNRLAVDWISFCSLE